MVTPSRPVAQGSAVWVRVPPFVRYSSLCRRAHGGIQAGCPSGQRERSVKPSATPSVVRIHHLPPPAKTARVAEFSATRAVLLCPAMCHLVALWTGVLRGPRTYSGRRPGGDNGRRHRRFSTDGHGRAALAARSGLTCAAESGVHPGETITVSVVPGRGVVRVEVTDRSGCLTGPMEGQSQVDGRYFNGRSECHRRSMAAGRQTPHVGLSGPRSPATRRVCTGAHGWCLPRSSRRPHGPGGCLVERAARAPDPVQAEFGEAEPLEEADGFQSFALAPLVGTKRPAGCGHGGTVRHRPRPAEQGPDRRTQGDCRRRGQEAACVRGHGPRAGRGRSLVASTRRGHGLEEPGHTGPARVSRRITSYRSRRTVSGGRRAARMAASAASTRPRIAIPATTPR